MNVLKLKLQARFFIHWNKMNAWEMLNSPIFLNHLCFNNVFILSQYEYAWYFCSISGINLQRNFDPWYPYSRPHRYLHKITVPIEIPDSTQLDESLLIRLSDHAFEQWLLLQYGVYSVRYDCHQEVRLKISKLQFLLLSIVYDVMHNIVGGLREIKQPKNEFQRVLIKWKGDLTCRSACHERA